MYNKSIIFAVDGRSSYEPVAPNDSPFNRAKNCRVAVYVFEPQQAQQVRQQIQQQPQSAY